MNSLTNANEPLTIPDLDDGIDMLTAALAYAAAGWYVLPVRRGTKKPGGVVGEHWQRKSSRDPKVITAWFENHNCWVAISRGEALAFAREAEEAWDDVDYRLRDKEARRHPKGLAR
jgi:bifunctional DNA primase/polymerase-like protein